MTQKWNLQDIRPVDKKRAVPEREDTQPVRQDIQDREPVHRKRREETKAVFDTVDIVDTKKSRLKRSITAILVAVVILGVGFAISGLMSGVEITVYPKVKSANIQATFTTYKEPAAGELGYELLTLEADGERQVSATGEENVSERAAGQILIYNAYSKSPQRLIKNTRFESPDGLIFRINESVEVPGLTDDGEGNVAPGVITADVFADGTGEQYNIAPSQFSIPGLKGSEQFESMYAESNEAFVGGFEGSKFIINDQELQTSKQALHRELRDALLARVGEERPAGFVLYDDAITFAFDSLPATEYGDDLVTIKEKARLQVPLFKLDELASYLAVNTVAGFEDAAVTLPDPFTLSFSYRSATTSTSDISLDSSLEFTLSGQTQIVWEFDEESLRNDLVGSSKTAVASVLSGYAAIENAETVVRPFWRQSFPENASEIEIITVLGESE